MSILTDFAVIDFETTGLDPEKDEIIEFGAVKVSGGQIVDRFSELCRPGRRIPPKITQLTGISDRDLSHARKTSEVLEDFIHFLGDESFLVAHHSFFEAQFLDALGAGFLNGRLLDSLTLARIVWPDLRHHSLEALSDSTGEGTENKHRAADDANLTARIVLRIIDSANALHPAVIQTIADLMEGLASPIAVFFKNLNQAADREAMLRPGGELDSLFEDFTRLMERARSSAPEQNESPPELLDTAMMANLFSEDGVFANRFPGFEHRPQQAEMVDIISEALNQGEHALIEAGTGTGKSLAYLTPAVGWALLNGEKIVISTNTRNLQDQLYMQDVPALREVLRKEFQAAVLKGAANYLCVRKFLRAIHSPAATLSEDHRCALAALTVWAVKTETGDIGECTGFNNLGGRELWQRYGLGGGECSSAACRQSARCFVYKARGQAAVADLIITNHALVFSEIGLESRVLPPYSCIVFDEAHNLENVITDNLSRSINKHRCHTILSRLTANGPGHGGTGVLDFITQRLGRVQGEPAEKGRQLVTKVRQLVEDCYKQCELFFDAASRIYEPPEKTTTEKKKGPPPQDRQRYNFETQSSEAWKQLHPAGGQFRSELGQLADRLGELKRALTAGEGQSLVSTSANEELQWRIDELVEFVDDAEFILAGEEENTVFWINRNRWQGDPTYSFHAAPVDVGPLMTEHFFEAKSTVILVSATLAVADKFDFFKQRVGLDALTGRTCHELLLGSCFDLDSQVLLMAPSFLPEPGYRQKSFNSDLADLLTDTFGISQGRGLVLCTSYDMLRDVHRQLKRNLSSQSILVLGQVVDGNTGQIANVFKANHHSVLVGTQSFWEGFDAPGKTLCCVVVAKLPFPVFTDPIVEARCELLESKGINSFMGYMVPVAAIRLKQGFGRLIRTATDYGLVILGDKRVLTKSYGSVLLKSLPVALRAFEGRAEFLHCLQDFLKHKDDDS